MAAKIRTQDFFPRQRIECAFAGCPNNVILRHKMPTGWANLCEKHRMEIQQEQAEIYCASLGLKTVAQMREWLSKNRLTLKRIPVERQPGEDLDEAA